MERLAGDGVTVLVPPDANKRAGARPGWDGGLYTFMRRVLATDQGGALYAKRQGDDRAGLRRHQVQPPRRSLLTPRPRRRPVGMAAHQRRPQPPQALAAHRSARDRLRVADGRSPRHRSIIGIWTETRRHRLSATATMQSGRAQGNPPGSCGQQLTGISSPHRAAHEAIQPGLCRRLIGEIVAAPLTGRLDTSPTLDMSLAVPGGVPATVRTKPPLRGRPLEPFVAPLTDHGEKTLSDWREISWLRGSGKGSASHSEAPLVRAGTGRAPQNARPDCLRSGCTEPSPRSSLRSAS